MGRDRHSTPCKGKQSSVEYDLIIGCSNLLGTIPDCGGIELGEAVGKQCLYRHLGDSVESGKYRW